MYKMSEKISLSEARKKLPELADRVQAGNTYIMSRRGRELAVLISIDEYHRLKAIEQQQRQKDFDVLLAPPPSDVMAEDAARDLAVQIVWEKRSRSA
jgi:prevent-host-death family protein